MTPFTSYNKWRSFVTFTPHTRHGITQRTDRRTNSRLTLPTQTDECCWTKGRWRGSFLQLQTVTGGPRCLSTLQTSPRCCVWRLLPLNVAWIPEGLQDDMFLDLTPSHQLKDIIYISVAKSWLVIEKFVTIIVWSLSCSLELVHRWF